MRQTEDLDLHRSRFGFSIKDVLTTSNPDTTKYYLYFKKTWQEGMYHSALYVLCRNLAIDPNLTHVRDRIIEMAKPVLTQTGFESTPESDYANLYRKIEQLITSPTARDLLTLADTTLNKERRLAKSLKILLKLQDENLPLPDERVTDLLVRAKQIYLEIDKRKIVLDTQKKTADTDQIIKELDQLFIDQQVCNPLFISFSR